MSCSDSLADQGKNYDELTMALKKPTLKDMVQGVEGREKNHSRRKSKSRGQRTQWQLCCRWEASAARGQWML